MAQKALNHPYIGTVLNQMGSEGVSNSVGADNLVNARLLR